MRTYTLKHGEKFEVKNGEVVHFSCCDCGLTHRVAFAKERNGKIGVAMERHLKGTRRRRLTKQIRMHMWLLLSMFDGENLSP